MFIQEPVVVERELLYLYLDISRQDCYRCPAKNKCRLNRIKVSECRDFQIRYLQGEIE